MRAEAILAAPLPEPPWGGLVTLYLIVIGLPSGLGLLIWWLTTQATVGGGAWFERQAQLVSLVALVFVGGLLVVDLGRPGGFYLMVTRFDNLGSPISLGAKLVAAKTGLVALAVYASQRSRRAVDAPVLVGSGGGPAGPPPRPAGGAPGAALQPVVRTLVAAASFALAIYPAALLSRTWSSPLGGTGGAALLFLTTSLVLGAAAAVVIVAPRWRPPVAEAPPAMAILRRLLLAVVTGHAIAVGFEALIVSGDPQLAGLVAAVTTGPYAVPWWLGVLTAGVAVPVAALVLLPRRRSAFVVAAAGAAAGAAATRYLLFTAGG
jgi:formate-dependent nitrite reductase membrane component NrfD